MIKYSLDDEMFDYDTAFEAIQDIDYPEVGIAYYSNETKPLDALRLISVYKIDCLLEDLDNAFFDIVGIEEATPFDEASSLAKYQLRDMLVKWVKEHTTVENYYEFVGKSTKHFVTEEDLKELNDD